MLEEYRPIPARDDEAFVRSPHSPALVIDRSARSLRNEVYDRLKFPGLTVVAVAFPESINPQVSV
jgi:hypothetical protein